MILWLSLAKYGSRFYEIYSKEPIAEHDEYIEWNKQKKDVLHLCKRSQPVIKAVLGRKFLLDGGECRPIRIEKATLATRTHTIKRYKDCYEIGYGMRDCIADNAIAHISVYCFERVMPKEFHIRFNDKPRFKLIKITTAYITLNSRGVVI